MTGKNKLQAMRAMGTFKTLMQMPLENESKEIQDMANDAINALNDAMITQAETLDSMSKVLEDLQKFMMEEN